MMATLTVNGASLSIRLLEVELNKLQLDPENPRLHSFYLTHELPAQPTQVQSDDGAATLQDAESVADLHLAKAGLVQV